MWTQKNNSDSVTARLLPCGLRQLSILLWVVAVAVVPWKSFCLFVFSSRCNKKPIIFRNTELVLHKKNRKSRRPCDDSDFFGLPAAIKAIT